MSSEKFQASKKEGAHQQLNALTGNWKGTTRTWFEPDKLADESPMEGKITAVLDGRFVLHEYTGSLNGKAFEGLAIYGFQFEEQKFQSAWIDSFHMGTGILFSEGNASGKKIAVLGSYGAAVGKPWGWRTEIEWLDKDKLAITAYNISPEGDEAKATETIYTRVD